GRRSPAGADLRQGRLVSLPLARRAGEHEYVSGRIDANANAFVRTETGVFDEKRVAQPDRSAREPRALAFRREAGRADGLGNAPQTLGIVPAVVETRAVVMRDQPDGRQS